MDIWLVLSRRLQVLAAAALVLAAAQVAAAAAFVSAPPGPSSEVRGALR